jgi:ATP-binding cassette subfamily B protein
MRRYSNADAAPVAKGPRNDWQTIRSLLPYLATYKWRVAFALTCLIGAKVANLGVPIVMKKIVDGLASVQQLTALGRAQDSPPSCSPAGSGCWSSPMRW